MKIAIVIGILVCLILVGLVSGVSAFTDVFEYQNEVGENITDLWTKTDNLGTGSYSVVAHSTYTQSNVMKVYVTAPTSSWYNVNVYNTNPSESNYWSFIVAGREPGGTYSYAYLNFLNTTGVQIASYAITSYYSSYHNDDLYEILREGNNLYLKINGISQGIITTCDEIPAHIVFHLNCYQTSQDLRIDGVTTTSGLVSVGVESDSHIITELDSDELDAIWAVKTIPESSYDAAEYKLLVKRVSTGEIINTTILKEAGNSSAKPCGFVVYNRMNLFGAEGYGYYLFYITKDGANQGEDWLFYKPLGTSSVIFDEETYYQGDIASISYTIDSADFGTYDYYVKVFDDSWSAVKTEEVTTDSGYVQWNTEDIEDAGFYTTILQAVGSSYDLAFDTAQVLKTIYIKGVTYDAKTGNVLGDVNVSFRQGGTYYNTTSNATTGNYSLQGIISAIDTNVNATKTNFTHSDFIVNFPTTGTYEMDLYLFPSNLTGATVIHGCALSYPLGQAVESANITIWNTTWTNTTTTSVTGYYNFSNYLVGGQSYSLNATAPGYKNSDTEAATAVTDNYVIQNILLYPSYTLTVRAKDKTSGAYVTGFQATLDDGTEGNTTTSVLTFTNLTWGYYLVTVSKEDYYAGYESILLQANSEIEVEIERIGEAVGGGPGVYYPPRFVEFRVIDWWGNGISDVTVSIITNETSMGSWDWLKDFLGFGNDTYSEIQTATMNGTTDNSGRISFMMVETIKYTITFVKGGEVSETLTIYPKESQYIVIITPTWTLPREDDITWNLSISRHSATYVNLSLNYTDSLNETSELWFYVKYKNGTEIFSQSFINNSTVVINYTIYEEPWEERIWGFNATQETFGALRQDKIITFRDGLRIDLNLTNENYYTWFSIASLILLGTLFSVTVAKFGYVVLPFISMLFWYIGWLALNFTILTTVLMLGILLFMGKTEKDKGL